jgi:hypothetical protein
MRTYEDLLPPDLTDAIDFIERGDWVTYTAPNGRVFSAQVIDKEHDDTTLNSAGSWGVYLLTAILWYRREDGNPACMRRILCEDDVTLTLKANSAN